MNTTFPVTFIITTHSKRIDNLQQMLRFLVKEPIIKKSEVIIVCSDKIDFADFKLINMELDHFCKPKMCNLAANMAQGNVLVFLDCDRILPEGWFSTQINTLKHGEVRSARYLYRLLKPTKDEDIRSAPKTADFKLARVSAVNNLMSKKTVFSGNAIIKRDDFLDLGGMDESFVGYGFSDTDMSYKAYKAGMRIKLTSDEELHLWHPIDDPETFQEENKKNAKKFLAKWNL